MQLIPIPAVAAPPASGLLAMFSTQVFTSLTCW